MEEEEVPIIEIGREQTHWERYGKAWYERNKEHAKEYRKEYFEKNKDKRQQYYKDYVAKNGLTTPIRCKVCLVKVQKSNYARHCKSKEHQDMQTQADSSTETN